MRAIKIDPAAKTTTEIELTQNPNETLQEEVDRLLFESNSCHNSFY